MADKPVPFAGEIGAEPAQKLEWCVKLRMDAEVQRRARESMWATNILLLEGKHYEAAAEDWGRFGRKPLWNPSTEQRVMANLAGALARQTVALIVDNQAKQIATAATSDIEDVEAAEIATDFVEGRMVEDRERELRQDECLWAMTCGTVLRDTYYDPDAPALTEAGRVEGLGDIKTAVLNPWRFHLCPWSSSAEDQPFIIVSDVRDVDEINDLYKPEQRVMPEEVAEQTQMLDRLASSIVTGSGGSMPRRQGAAILYRMQCRASKAFPKGRVFTWANQVLLKEADLPEGRMGQVRQDWFPIPGRGYSLPFMTPLVTLQRQVNETLSHIAEMRERQMRLDQVLQAPDNEIVTQEHAKRQLGVDETGQPILEDTPQRIVRIPMNAVKWEFLEYDAKVTDAEIYLNRLWLLMQEVAGVHAPTLGGPMPASAPGMMAQLQKDSDLSGVAIFRHGFDRGNCRTTTLKLVIARNHFIVPRMLRCVGQNNEVKTRSFFGSELRQTEDVRPKCVPMVSETVKQQLVRENAPLFDLSGTAHVKLMKVRALLASGIPNIEEEVERLLAPYSVEDLEQVCAQINRIDIQTSVIAAQGALDAATMAVEAQKMQAEGMTAGAGEGQAGEGMGPTGPMGPMGQERQNVEEVI